MKRLIGAIFAFSFLTLTLPALAGGPTKAQREELNRLLDNGSITAIELEAFLGQNRLGIDSVTTAVTATYEVEVICDFQKSIEVGKYDWVNTSVTRKNFPVSDGCVKGRTEVALFHFDRVVSSEKAITEMDREGYRSATLPELLALGAAEPELQRKFLLLALGSVWRHPNGRLCVPILDDDGSCYLSLAWFASDWRPYYRFLAVRK